MTATLFPVPPDTTVLTLRPILDGAPVMFVERDEEGAWRFLDAQPLLRRDDLALVPLQRVLDGDPSLSELAELPAGWRAWRLTADGPWERESSRTLERTRARSAEALAALHRNRITLPPGSPTSTELLREDRDR